MYFVACRYHCSNPEFEAIREDCSLLHDTCSPALGSYRGPNSKNQCQQAIQRFAAAAAEESTRLGTQLVRMAEESLDICLIDPPLPLAAPADSQGVAAQILSALAGNTSAAGLAMSAADLASRLPIPSPPPLPPSVDKSWKCPGWLLLVFGFTVRAYT